jgi:hypothetical protein
MVLHAEQAGPDTKHEYRAPGTSAPAEPRRLGRSIGAVFAGIFTIAVLDNGIDFVLHSTGIYPPLFQTMSDGLFLLALAYRTVDAILGCTLTAYLAPRRPLAHTLTLGGIGVVLSSLGVLATLAGGPEFGPLWYPLALVAISLPCGYLGARIVESRRQPQPEVAVLA